MKYQHLTDSDIQKIIFGNADIDKEALDHLRSCEKCITRADSYKIILESVSKREKSKFDFDISELVMSRLPVMKREPTFTKLVIRILVFICAPLAGLTIFLFSTSLSDLFTGITPIFFYLSGIVIAGLLLFNSIDVYIHFRKHMKVLDIY
jgi:hypothetical protein